MKKTTTFLSLGVHKGRQSYSKSFLYFCGSILHSWIRIRILIQILNPDPDSEPLIWLNSDPIWIRIWNAALRSWDTRPVYLSSVSLLCFRRCCATCPTSSGSLWREERSASWSRTWICPAWRKALALRARGNVYIQGSNQARGRSASWSRAWICPAWRKALARRARGNIYIQGSNQARGRSASWSRAWICPAWRKALALRERGNVYIQG